jgi:isoquinoline 1-oxidoreductase beta subunit
MRDVGALDDGRSTETPGKIPDKIKFRKVSRREFLKLTGISVTGLTLAYSFTPLRVRAQADKVFRPNGFVQIGEDGVVTLYNKAPEVGQGIKTSFPMIIAEEMDAKWEEVRVEQAPIDEAIYGQQFAGGSRNTPSGWDQHRQAGAVARAMLVGAAAQRWGVSADQCSTADSAVNYKEQSLGYAELAGAAAELPVPDADSLKLKERNEYTLLGTRISGVDNEAIVTGKPLFGIDTRLPGMQYATFAKCPAWGGTVISANLDEIKQLPGVSDAFILEGNHKQDLGRRGMPVMPGVAIVATSTWAALQASTQLKVEWDETDAAKDSITAAAREAERLAKGPGEQVLLDRGDVEKGLADSTHTVEAFYSYPFVSHAPMEPQNCTAWHHDGMIELWAPTQTPQQGIIDAANATGLSKEQVTVHQTRMGGGFGRRLLNDYMAEVAAIAMRVDAPVKLQWSREEDMRHDHYRVAGFHSLKGGVDDQGRLDSWQNHFITFSENGKDAVSGGSMRANDIAANLIPNAHTSQTMMPLKIRTGPWRAPGSNAITFAHQSFIHELAVAAGRDHVEFLIEIMGEPRWLGDQGIYDLNTGRAIDVIKMAADKAGWGRPAQQGRGLGLAFSFAHAGHVAEIADVSVDANRKVTIHRVTVVADVGPIINRNAAENQCQGCVIDGISTMMGLALSIENGRIREGNFDQYPILRVDKAPRVDVHFIESEHSPTGLGEPGIPPVAPAVANAIFAATGERVRELPLSKAGYTT